MIEANVSKLRYIMSVFKNYSGSSTTLVRWASTTRWSAWKPCSRRPFARICKLSSRLPPNTTNSWPVRRWWTCLSSSSPTRACFTFWGRLWTLVKMDIVYYSGGVFGFFIFKKVLYEPILKHLLKGRMSHRPNQGGGTYLPRIQSLRRRACQEFPRRGQTHGPVSTDYCLRPVQICAHLVLYLYRNNLQKYIEVFVQKVVEFWLEIVYFWAYLCFL